MKLLYKLDLFVQYPKPSMRALYATTNSKAFLSCYTYHIDHLVLRVLFAFSIHTPFCRTFKVHTTDLSLVLSFACYFVLHMFWCASSLLDFAHVAITSQYYSPSYLFFTTPKRIENAFFASPRRSPFWLAAGVTNRCRLGNPGGYLDHDAKSFLLCILFDWEGSTEES
ncbi:hypothetical protein FA15DRAFT_232733 [Coprinopsis marcescibilis]|uniref:Uncharacterized protein n=1 Tax=Coprinopsis marcescibilis TaxID=230819 RepID=A0A5C3KGL5_COPMA|nr:hypothetical protein FA15DRAFT_232733 [Coprinopsis marcescibilis]